jgi:hypothetical protein
MVPILIFVAVMALMFGLAIFGWWSGRWQEF